MSTNATRCRTCVRKADDPYRLVIEGVIQEGCVDAFHTGHLAVGSATFAWHDRAESKAIRGDTRRYRFPGEGGAR